MRKYLDKGKYTDVTIGESKKTQGSSWEDNSIYAVTIISKKTAEGINLHKPLCGENAQIVSLHFIGIPDNAVIWEQAIGRFRRTGIDTGKLVVNSWHLDSDPIPDHKSMMCVADSLCTQTIFSKGGLSVDWISRLLGRCHVWDEFSRYKAAIQNDFKDNLKTLFGDGFRLKDHKDLLRLDLHENQDLARSLERIEIFLCDKEDIITVVKIEDLREESQFEEHVRFRQLTSESSSETLFAIKTYESKLEQLMKKVIVPFYGFKQRWIRFEGNVMPFWVIVRKKKFNIRVLP